MEVDEALSQLVMLANKCRQNKNKLNSADSEVAREKLKILFGNPEYVSRAFQLMVDLPNSCCQTIPDAWLASDEDYKEKIVQLLLNEPALTGTAGFSRKITIIAAFIPVDTQTALRLLVDLSGRLTQDGTNSPVRPLVGRFLKELMATKKLLGISLEKYDITVPQISGIAAMVLLGMLNSSEPDIAMITDFINWLDRCHSKAILGTSLITEAEKVANNWPEDLQRRCQSLGLIKTVSFRIPPNPTVKPDFNESKVQVVHMLAQPENGGGTITGVSPAGHGKSSGSVTEAREPESASRDKLNVQICFDWLAQYISSLEKENALLNKKLDTLKDEYHREKMRSNEHIKQLAVVQAEQKRQESLIRDLEDRMTGLEKDKRELLNSLQEERFARAKEVDHLKNQIDRECTYVIGEFRNKLLDRLSRYYREYVEASVRPPSNELAEHLKFVFDRVFRELINQGIKFDGDK